jgi:hypothetical protein
MGFQSMIVQMEYVMDKVSLEQVSLQLLQSSPDNYHSTMLHVHLSSWAETIGPFEALVAKDCL